MRNDFPRVEEQGLVGDLQTAALIAHDGAVTWFCAPRFDSPSIFASLLDPEQGGTFTVRPEGVDVVCKQLYLPGTPVLITRFLSDRGVGEVVDFMPVTAGRPTDRHRLVRLLRVVRGAMTFRVRCQPRFNYGRDDHEVQTYQDGAVYRSRTATLTTHIIRAGAGLLADRRIERDGRDAQVFVELTEGDAGGVVLETGDAGTPRTYNLPEVLELLRQTQDFWRAWLDRSPYRGRWRETVQRSAMTLKLLTYAPTGAIIAAPTAGLPERIGGTRNWDYRYTWIRDAALTVLALLRLGFTQEATGAAYWLNDRIREAADNTGQLQIMYRIDGSSDLQEETLEHWAGYRNSSPVRIGNGAAGQLQLDMYGAILEAFHYAGRRDLGISHHGWQNLATLVDWLSDHWDQPDDGIWEVRASRRDHTYSRVMCWVAFDRAIRLAARLGRPADTHRWIRNRDAVYKQIISRGYHHGRQSFVQHYGADVLDASLLTMPALGFVTPADPLWQGTLRAIDNDLVSDSLVYRYDPQAAPDGLPGAEGTFSMCTFWYIDALARSGRLDDARLTFDKMLTYSSPLGLYSEEIAPNGEQIGNYPQAFSHLSLINTALTLDRLLDASENSATGGGTGRGLPQTGR
jgi:GH15 family glucan-1,4-alpha-glucosidase